MQPVGRPLNTAHVFNPCYLYIYIHYTATKVIDTEYSVHWKYDAYSDNSIKNTVLMPFR